MEDKKTKSAIIIYESKFGNTRIIAKSLALGIETAGVHTLCINIHDMIHPEIIPRYDLVAIGAPTQKLTASKTMKEFLKKLERMENIKGKFGFAFDTRYDRFFAGSAAKYIEKKLSRLGLDLIAPRQSAIVEKAEGPLGQDMEREFEQIGEELGNVLVTKDPDPLGMDVAEEADLRSD